MRIRLLGASVLLALTIPATVLAGGPLVAAPKVVSFGSMTVGSCDLTTYVGCTTKTVTIKNNTPSTIDIRAYGVLQDEVALVPLANGECHTLPPIEGGWALAPGASCLIGVTMGPADAGPISASLIVWSVDLRILAEVRLIGIGIGR